MKQKRKVKSLISSKDRNNALLTALLFLLGGILCFGAVALFTSLGGVASAAGEEDFEYIGIDDNQEVLIDLKFAPDGGSNTINEMLLTGNSFRMVGNTGISVDATMIINGYVNYLGGETEGVNVASDNITIIGGKGAKVYQKNPNTAILGGINDKIGEGKNGVAPVMIGGSGNEIGANQVGSAIVGGKGNKIQAGGSYDFILGGEGSSINGSNVIVGGTNVEVDGKSNLFAFNDGDSKFTPKGGKAFYLKVRNGLGLNKAAVNKGVDSNGAVSFGAVNIVAQDCTSDDVGVQGIWKGCLVGCTKASKDDHNKWEMIDHGDTCEGYCKDYPSDCLINPIEPTPPTDYTSECTVGGVDTSNSTQCAANRLAVYENVMFETYLIDSDDKCPEGIENKCVFKCDKDYHLTGGQAGTSTRTKCYADCTLPWNGEKIKHNETVTGYNAKTVACSNTDYVFPVATAIVNVPTTEYGTRTLNGMLKASTSYGSYESCTNYTHKKTLVCNDGTLYIAKLQSGKRKATSNEALGGTGAWYGYDVCTTKDYKCSTGTYNLTQSYITTNSIAPDTVSWNNTDRSTSNGTRGQYKLCLDWTPSVGNSECKVGRDGANGTPSDSYHYQLVKCQAGYSTGTDNNPYECKKSCYLSGTSIEFKHNTTVTGYTMSSEDCTAAGDGTCHPETIVCNDGTWRTGSKTGPEDTQHKNYNCVLNEYKCDSRFDINQTNQTTRQTRYPNSEYESCTPYKALNGDKFHCTEQTNQYDLTGCNEGYHTENNYYCISNEKSVSCTGKPSYSTYYYAYRDYERNGTWNAGSWVLTNGDCSWYCNNGYHLSGSSCASDTQTYACTKPAHSHRGTSTEVRKWSGSSWDDPNGEMEKVQDCEWFCDDRYERVGNTCEYVPEGCSSSACVSLHDGESCTTYERCRNTEVVSTCSDGDWDVTPTSYSSPNMSCSSCHGCPGSYDVSDGGTCESYAQCSSDKVTSTCDDGDWDIDPEDYSSANQGCGYSCGGTTPIGNGVSKGDSSYTDGYTPTSWTYKSSGTLGACEWRCDTNYVQNGSKCNPKTQDKSCGTSAPSNSSWVKSTFTQTRNGSSWTPSSKTNTCVTSSTSTTECSFICDTNYKCNSTNTACEPSSTPVCTGLPDNATPNNSTAPTTDTAYTYSTNTSAVCTFQCNTNYTWNSTTKKCVANTQNTSCGTAPSGSTWAKGTYKQTWNGSAWTPSSKPSNTCVTSSSSSIECSFICDNGQECDGTTGCKDKPYGEVECGEENYTCEGTGATMTYNDDMSSTEFKWKCTSEDGKKTQNCSNSCPSGQTLTWSSLHNGSCVTYVDVELSCSKTSSLSESSYNDSTPRGWEMEHDITLSLNKSIPTSVSASIYYDVDNGSSISHNSSALTFSTNSRTATISLQSHNDGCHSLGLSTTAGHAFLSNWSWSAGEVQVGNTIYRISSVGNGCTDDDFDNANGQYCGPQCGSASTYTNGYFIAPPDSDLCSAGEVGDSPSHYPVSSPSWTRTCKIGSTTKSCTARYALAGSCGDSENTCDAGTKQNYNSSTHTRECAGGYGGKAYCGCNFSSCPLGYTYNSSDNKCHLSAQACVRFSEVSFGSSSLPDGDMGEIVTTSYCSDGYTEYQYGLANTLLNDALCSVSYPSGLNVYNGGSCYDIEDGLYYEDGDAPGGTTCDTGIFGGRNPNGSQNIPSGCYLRNIGYQWDGIYEYVCSSSDTVIDPCTGTSGECSVVNLSNGI